METISSGPMMLPALVVGALVSFGAVYAAPVLLFGWSALALIIAGVLVGTVCIGSLGFALWGEFLGFPWHFTK